MSRLPTTAAPTSSGQTSSPVALTSRVPTSPGVATPKPPVSASKTLLMSIVVDESLDVTGPDFITDMELALERLYVAGQQAVSRRKRRGSVSDSRLDVVVSKLLE